MVIGERIKRLRTARKLSRAKLAAASGITPLTVLRTETGQTDPKLETLRSIARGLGVGLEELVEDPGSDDGIAALPSDVSAEAA